MVFLGDRVGKAKCLGVQGLSSKGFCGFGAGCIGGQATASSIGRIADERMANVRSVDPDLVGASGFKIAINLGGGAAKCFNDTDARDGVAASVEQNGLFLPVGLVAGKLRCDLDDISRFEIDTFDAAQAGIALIWHAVAKRTVGAFDAMGGELIGEAVVGGV